MDNFFFGMQAVTTDFFETLRRLLAYELFLGFIFGFFISTLVHGFLISEDPRNLPRMILQDRAKSFQKIHPPVEHHTYKESFLEYSKKVMKLKTSSLLTVIFLLCLIIFGLLF